MDGSEQGIAGTGEIRVEDKGSLLLMNDSEQGIGKQHGQKDSVTSGCVR